MEHPPHQAEGEDIENRADRSEEDHKAPEIGRVPALRLADLLIIDVIKRDRHLGDIVQQVLNQQVQRQHRQKRQEGAGHQHAEDVTEVGAGGHFDVLEHVGEGAAAFDYPLLQYHQALLQQNDIRRLAGDIHRAVDRDANIRRAQRRSVVDAIAHKAHHVTFAFQQRHDTLFMQRRQAGEQRGAFGQRRQLVVAHGFNLAANHHFASIQSHFMAHLRRHQLAVAGEDLHRDAAGLQRLQRRGGGLFRRIEEGDVTFKDQVRLIGALVVAFAGRQVFGRHRHHPQPLSVEGIGHPANAAQHGVVQRYDIAVVAHLGRDVEDLLQRPFADQLMRGVILLHHHRHAAAFEVEGYLIHLLPAFRQPAGGIQLNPVQHRGVEQVFQAGLVVAVEPGGMQYPLADLAGDVGMVLQHNLILGQGAGFISAEDVHRAEILNGVEVLHDDLLLRQLHRPARQRRSDDHRQHLRRQADRHRQRE